MPTSTDSTPKRTAPHQKNETHGKNMPKQVIKTEVLIVGAGASGLYCALTAGSRGRQVTVIDHANKAGKKILMSGGGRCNFTNYFVEPEHFIGSNPHFCKSALSRYPSWEFIAKVQAHGVAYHERDYGQLFCDDSAKDVLNILLKECQDAGVKVQLRTEIERITPLTTSPNGTDSSINNSPPPASSALHPQAQDNDNQPAGFVVHTNAGIWQCQSLVIATGGLSIPTMGATGFGYQVATQFGHDIVPTSAGLVPFTFSGSLGETIASLSGISIDVIAFNERISFPRPMLFTHRGLSGPAMLQLSNYWALGESIHINLLPNIAVGEWLLQEKQQHPKQLLRTSLHAHFPKKLLLALQSLLWSDVQETELSNIKDERLLQIGQDLNDWEIKPSGTEGYRTAEVTRGGVATDAVSSKTMESQLMPQLYFIGEVLDVTGWLGGYNFQWAWASGYACGQVV